MKTAQTYWERYGERAFSMACGTAAYLPYLLAKSALWKATSERGQPITFRQPRVGTGSGDLESRLIGVNKLRTRVGHQAVCELAERFRTSGVDELAQSANLLDGTMLLRSHRPLMATCDDPQATTYEMMMDNLRPTLQRAYDSMTRTRPPGVANTYSLHVKGRTLWLPDVQVRNRFELQAVMDLRDRSNNTLRSNLEILGQYGLFLAENLRLIQLGTPEIRSLPQDEQFEALLAA